MLLRRYANLALVRERPAGAERREPDRVPLQDYRSPRRAGTYAEASMAATGLDVFPDHFFEKAPSRQTGRPRSIRLRGR